MFVLDGVCMKLIFIGESVKTIDKLSEGELFPLYPVIPWKEIMKLRDVIAQQDTLIEYFYPADNYGKGLLYHCCLGLKERDARRYTQSRQSGD